jgi:geranylgeranyl diphosphate synthase type I
MIKTDKKIPDSEQFTKTLLELKKLIDKDIELYSEKIQNETYECYGENPTLAVKAYLDLLKRGGKRIRGTLTITAYKMLGGKNDETALQAARAIEMMHAYILMVDDIQDRSETRRGGPTAHIQLKNYHEHHHLKDESQHFGESIAMNGFLFGVHNALNVLINLDCNPEYRLAAIKNVNDHFISTAHGQSMDIFNEVLETSDVSDVEKVMTWKTAYYTFMNPLQLGAILAGASSDDLKDLEKYSLHAGRAFQITDDIIGVFGEEDASGKSPLDDIKEGKRTLLTVKALELAPKADSYFLEQMLGNKNLTNSEFLQCREIIEQSGALEYAKNQAKSSVIDALASIDKLNDSLSKEQVNFLKQLVSYLVDRKS